MLRLLLRVGVKPSNTDMEIAQSSADPEILKMLEDASKYVDLTEEGCARDKQVQ